MVLVVAIAEGADFDLINSPRARNLSPWLSNVIAEEPCWTLQCGPAPYEPSNLATAFSGRGRGHHGCHSYWKICSPGSGRPPVLQSHDVAVPRLWHWEELKGLRIAVLNVPLTHPPSPIDGTMLSYLMEQTLRYAHPAGFEHEMKRRGIRYGHDVSVFYRGEPGEEFYRRARMVAENQLEAALAIGREHDVLIVNLTIVDRLSHFFWHELENGSDDPLVLRAYAFLDQALSALDALADPDPLIVFSEIGFGGLDRFESLDRALVEAGFAVFEDDGNISDAARAREAVQGSHGVVLERWAKSRTLRDEVIACLVEAKNGDGRPLVSAALPREIVYDGPAMNAAPEIIVTPANPRRPPAGDPRWARHVNRHLQTGWHRDRGFVAVRRGHPVASRAVPAQLESIAPSVVSLLGREPPAWSAPPLVTR
jgi:predicted AlkP superfamily phosphohydrolase/phosphomutase